MCPFEHLKKGDSLPSLQLSNSAGGEVRLGDFRGRRNLVLFLAHPPGCAFCEATLRELQESLDRLQAEDAEVLAIVPGSRDAVRALKQRLALSFPVLVGGGELVGGRAALAVTDRFGEVFAVMPADEEHLLPTAARLVEELTFVELQCPE